jgi:hypothetical protein
LILKGIRLILKELKYIKEISLFRDDQENEQLHFPDNHDDAKYATQYKAGPIPKDFQSILC